MQTILVPTDFSDAAGNAAEYAARLARAVGAELCLLHVYTLPVPVSQEAPLMTVSPEMLQKGSEESLKKEADRIMMKLNVKVRYIACMGYEVDEITEEQKNADLVIMGMRGSGLLTETILGSTTTAAIKKTTKPVLVIPVNSKYKKPEKIVFACDFDPKTDMETLDFMKQLTKQFNSKYTLLT
jgi:nucleotide-binding universal stress UspA family protein